MSISSQSNREARLNYLLQQLSPRGNVSWWGQSAVVDPDHLHVRENGQDFHMQDILEAMRILIVGRTQQTSITTRSGQTTLMRGNPVDTPRVLWFTLDPRMITLPQVEVDQEEAVCHVLEVRCPQLMRMIRVSVIGLSMFLSRSHWLTALTRLQSLKSRICSDARRHVI